MKDKYKNSFSFSTSNSMKMNECNKKMKSLIGRKLQHSIENENKIKNHLLDTNEEKYCKYCNKVFKNIYSLKTHIRIHSGERPYLCTVCEKSFKQIGHLKNHTLIHSGTKPYFCNFENCEKKFSSSHNLKMHIRIHNKERPFICNVCCEKFTQNAHLQNHSKKHIRNRNYKCKICEKSFITNNAFMMHKKKCKNESRDVFVMFDNNHFMCENFIVNYLTVTEKEINNENNLIHKEKRFGKTKLSNKIWQPWI